MRLHEGAAVREYREAVRHLERGQLRRAERGGQVGRNVLLRQAEALDVFARIADTDLAHDADRDEVARARERVAKPGRPIEAPRVVHGPPIFGFGLCAFDCNWILADANHGIRRFIDHRRIEHHGRRREPRLERSRINEWLERRPGLAPCLDDAVVLRGVVVETAREGDNRAIVRIERDERALDLGQLHEKRFILVRWKDVHDIADLHDVPRRFRRRVSRSSPADAFHRKAIAHAAARHDRRLAGRGAHDDRRDQAPDDRPILDQACELGIFLLFDIDPPDRAAPAVAPVVFEHGAPERDVCGALQAAVHRRDDLESLGVNAIAELLVEVEPHHFADVRSLDLHARPVESARDRLVHRSLPGRFVDVAELAHAAQHVAAPLSRLLDARNGILARRRLEDSGEQCRLARVHVGERLAEVGFGRGREPVGALAEELRVHEEREDLLLVELGLEREREEDFAQLAPELLLFRDERGAHELLGQGASALRELHGRRRDDDGAHDALPVDTGMLEEAVVFRSEDGLHDDRRYLLPGHRDAALFSDLREQATVPAVDAKRNLQAHVAQHCDVRQRWLQVIVSGKKSEPDQAHDRNYDGGRDSQPPFQARSHRIRLCIVMSGTAGSGVACPRRRDRDAKHGWPFSSRAASSADLAPEACGRERPDPTVKAGGKPPATPWTLANGSECERIASRVTFNLTVACYIVRR